MTYLIPEADLNEVVRRMNAERLVEWQRYKVRQDFSEPVKKRKIVEPAKIEPELEDKIEHILMPKTSTYALGVYALRDAYLRGGCSDQPLFDNLVRPLTFRENILARVEDYERIVGSDGKGRDKKERLRLFEIWLDSCTGIGYKAGTTKF